MSSNRTYKLEKEKIALEKYKIVWQAYDSEIKNLWQRSVFLGTFMVLAWTGYASIAKKILEECKKSCPANIDHYAFTALTLCFVLMILSLLWIAMAKGSKFIQEAHEKHLKEYNSSKNLYCDFEIYETRIENKNDNLLMLGVLEPYRYSVSKINIVLGWFSLLIASVTLIIHTYSLKISRFFPILKEKFLTFLPSFPIYILDISLILFPIALCTQLLKNTLKENWFNHINFILTFIIFVIYLFIVSLFLKIY